MPWKRWARERRVEPDNPGFPAGRHLRHRSAGISGRNGRRGARKAFGEVADCEKVLLVFGGDDFINSAGLAVLFDLILPAKEKGVQFRIVHPAQHFRKVFEIVGLSKDVGVFPEEREALADW
jgi:anti-anti-sigma factor